MIVKEMRDRKYRDFDDKGVEEIRLLLEGGNYKGVPSPILDTPND